MKIAFPANQNNLNIIIVTANKLFVLLANGAALLFNRYQKQTNLFNCYVIDLVNYVLLLLLKFFYCNQFYQSYK